MKIIILGAGKVGSFATKDLKQVIKQGKDIKKLF